MNFSEELQKYMRILNATGKEISNKSGIPAPIISGYKNGSKLPKYNSDTLEKLIDSLYEIAKSKKIKINKKDIKDDLERYLVKDSIDFEVFRNNLNTLIDTLNINVSELSKFIGFDSSYVSKIRSGYRKPLNINDFAEAICKFTLNNYLGTQKELIDSLINKFDEKKDYFDELYFWLTNNQVKEKNTYEIDSFFKKLDDFDLNNYIKAIKFDKLIVPTIPKVLFKSKTYHGMEGYKNAQLEVLKQIAFTKGNKEMFWYSNMPMVEISKDIRFTKKYMMYLAIILKKGIKLNMIHDLDRPFNELMLGLEGWIPLYMTGQIKSYYFKNNSNLIYSHIECTSNTSILHGETITGNIDKAKLLVSNKKEDVKYYSDNSKLLLKKASPLMNIYNESDKDAFKNMTQEASRLKGNRRNILLTPPIYTISNSLLNNILDNNKVSKSDKKEIINYVDKLKEKVKNILENNNMFDEITILTKEDFESSKVILDLSEIFYKNEIVYTYESYINHISDLKGFEKQNKNYKYKINNSNIFKNINVHIIPSKEVIISKINSPTTHFVIYHPKLIHAIENFKVPIKEIDK